VQRKVDAVVTFEPVRSKLLAAGAREIFSSREIPDEVVDVLVVQKSFLEQHPERVRKLTEGWFAALDLMKKDMDKSAAIMAERQKITVDQVLQGYKGIRIPDREANVRMLGEGSQGLVRSMQRLNDTLLQHGLIRSKLDLDRQLTARCVQPAR
jgi:NitT/TauT family transport system substrate-binding protein